MNYLDCEILRPGRGSKRVPGDRPSRCIGLVVPVTIRGAQTFTMHYIGFPCSSFREREATTSCPIGTGITKGKGETVDARSILFGRYSKTCPQCGGSGIGGRRHGISGAGEGQYACPRCRGIGSIGNCPDCAGTGSRGKTTVSVEVVKAHTRVQDAGVSGQSAIARIVVERALAEKAVVLAEAEEANTSARGATEKDSSSVAAPLCVYPSHLTLKNDFRPPFGERTEQQQLDRSLNWHRFHVLGSLVLVYYRSRLPCGAAASGPSSCIAVLIRTLSFHARRVPDETCHLSEGSLVARGFALIE